MKLDLERYAPPGVNWRLELKWLAVGLSASALYSLGFFVTFFSERNSLYSWNGVEKVLCDGAVMPDFAQVLGSSLAGFLIAAFCMAAVLAWHYAYHYQGTKSIYLMRRLPSRWELHRRCLALPLAAALGSLCVDFLLLLLYFGIYMVFTPNLCLTPDQWAKLWNA